MSCGAPDPDPEADARSGVAQDARPRRWYHRGFQWCHWRGWRGWLRDGLVLLLVLLAVQLWQTRAVPAGAAPDFQMQTLQGESFQLSQWRVQQGDGPVLLYFWAEWCPVCKVLEGTVDGLGQDWPLLSIAMQSGSHAEVARHLAARGLQWTTVADMDGSLAGRYGLKGVPALVVLDGQGEIRFVSVGLSSSWGMRLRLWWAGVWPG